MLFEIHIKNFFEFSVIAFLNIASIRIDKFKPEIYKIILDFINCLFGSLRLGNRRDLLYIFQALQCR